MTRTAEARTLTRASVVDALADALRSRILSGALAPGAPLREEALSTAYDVSRHTLRAAHSPTPASLCLSLIRLCYL